MDEMKSSTDPHDEALNDPVLSVLFTELRAVADRPAPPVDTELSAILAGATPLAAARDRRSRTARTAIIGLVTTGILAGGLGAAAANELPRPAQRIVSRVVNGLTPFNIPNPDEQGPVEHQPDTTIEDDGDQPGQDVDQPGHDKTGPDETGPGGTGPGGSEQRDQGNGQGDQSGGDQSGGDQSGGEQTDGSGGQGGASDGDADQQGSGQEATNGTTGETGGTGNDSGGGSGANGAQQDTNGSGQN